MNLFDLIKNALVSYIFENMDNYLAYIGNLENLQEKTISFLIDFISFLVPLAIIFMIFIIPFYFIIQAFNKLIKSLRTNVYVDEERTPREKRRKRG